jgi:hypothetical protein
MIVATGSWPYAHDLDPVEHRPEAALPNLFAYFALFSWPVVCIVLFVRLPVEKAAIWSMLAGYLLLPSAMTVDVPGMPPLDKFSIPSLVTILLCWMKGTKAPPPRRSLVIYFLLGLFIVSPIFTTFTNNYELQVGNKSLPGFYLMDGVKYSLQNAIAIAPFFIGMRFLSTPDARALLLKAIPTAALFYSIPMWIEIRLSPQFHRWVYGYHPHSFVQQYRDGGFRPVVFLGHGLEVALFTSLAVVGAIICARAKWQFFGRPASYVASYLAILLVFCKTLGAGLYVIVAAPIALFTRPKTWVRASLAILIVLCAYPLLRANDIIPVHHISDFADSISKDRNASLNLRLTNEDSLLARANEKPFLGWGSWGRNRIYQAGTGEDLSVTDGLWIIQFGSLGWLGYLSLFGLFAASVWQARGAVRGPMTQDSIVVGGLSLLLAVNALDLIPNSNLRPFTYLISGTIAGCVAARYRRKVISKDPVGVPTVVEAVG